MSTHDRTLPDDAHGHDDDHDEGMPHSTFRGYMTGFILSIILTAIPFWLVMTHTFETSSTTALLLLLCAAIQIVVHMIYFLHMNAKAEGGWTMLALIFTIVLVVITLSGSLWVMFHLNQNMMPGMMPDPRGLP